MPPISAQISLYPLRQESLGEPIDELVSILRSHQLEVRVGPMSTLVLGDSEVLFDGLKRAFHNAAERGHVAMVATFSNACPVDPVGSQ
jgi:uncharacterized protein YqgV (UPF0045/DUF77 family)